MPSIHTGSRRNTTTCHLRKDAHTYEYALKTHLTAPLAMLLQCKTPTASALVQRLSTLSTLTNTTNAQRQRLPPPPIANTAETHPPIANPTETQPPTDPIATSHRWTTMVQPPTSTQPINSTRTLTVNITTATAATATAAASMMVEAALAIAQRMEAAMLALPSSRLHLRAHIDTGDYHLCRQSAANTSRSEDTAVT